MSMKGMMALKWSFAWSCRNLSKLFLPRAMGLYEEVNKSFRPTTPERAIWDHRGDKKLRIYMAVRPDSFCEWSVENRMEELALGKVLSQGQNDRHDPIEAQ
jgi:hypothetical protein